MNLEKQISEKEKEGRDKVISVFGNKYDLQESLNPGDSWDMSGYTSSIMDGDKNFFIEVKSREVASTNYDTCFLEYKKFYNLKYIADYHQNADIFYACTYTDDVMFIFNLRKLNLIDIYITIVEAPKISLKSQDNKTPKLMLELPFALGHKYNLSK